jgi:riboflavin biosynthesis pyrimidine reductase
MRLLVGTGAPRDLTDDEVAEAYRPPPGPFLRANFVATVDGSATGPDGRSGSINNDADHVVFAALRSHADAVVVGAGTARDEGYGPADVPIVVVSRRGQVPDRLRDGGALLVTCAASPGLAQARDLLGEDGVLVLGDDEVDLRRLRPALHERGFQSLLCEGGPRLLTDLVAVGAVDEFCLTTVPTLVGGDHPRILGGAALDATARLASLLEADGTLLARWSLVGQTAGRDPA